VWILLARKLAMMSCGGMPAHRCTVPASCVCMSRTCVSLCSALDAIVMPMATFQLQMAVYHVLISIAQAARASDPDLQGGLGGRGSFAWGLPRIAGDLGAGDGGGLEGSEA